jgi:hypothetical protein
MNEIPAQTIATIGVFLTLTSLLGTFFYVQLSTWVRDIISLRAKYSLNRGINTEAGRTATREGQYALSGLLNPIPLITSLAISAFIGFASYKSYNLLGAYNGPGAVIADLSQVFGVFLAIYTVLVVGLLAFGYGIGLSVRSGLRTG